MPDKPDKPPSPDDCAPDEVGWCRGVAGLGWYQQVVSGSLRYRPFKTCETIAHADEFIESV